MKLSRVIAQTWVGVVLIVVLPLVTLKGEINSYYPVLTEPGYEERIIGESVSFSIRETRLNLTGVDPGTGRIIVPIIQGFFGNNPVRTSTILDHPSLSEIRSETDWVLSGDYLSALSIENFSIPISSAIGPIKSRINYQHRSSPISEIMGNPGQFWLKRKVRVGELIRNEATEESYSGEEGDAFRDESTGTVTTTMSVVGTDLVSTLVPGSDITLITDAFQAIVIVSEVTTDGVSKTFINGELFSETPTSVTSTRVEWRVKGFGRVRSRSYSGAWLTDIIESQVFSVFRDDDSRLASLDQLIPPDFIITEELRSGGGSVGDARDTVFTSEFQEFELWRIASRITIFDPAEEAGLEGDDLDPLAIPFSDGNTNLIKYAFNMDLGAADSRTLIPQIGTAGLPFFSTQFTDVGIEMRLEFIRRKGNVLNYFPEFASTLEEESFQAMDGTESVESIDEVFERVVITSPMSPGSSAKGFTRIRIEIP